MALQGAHFVIGNQGGGRRLTEQVLPAYPVLPVMGALHGSGALPLGAFRWRCLRLLVVVRNPDCAEAVVFAQGRLVVYGSASGDSLLCFRHQYLLASAPPAQMEWPPDGTRSTALLPLGSHVLGRGRKGVQV